jgi:hypothetical protein
LINYSVIYLGSDLEHSHVFHEQLQL